MDLFIKTMVLKAETGWLPKDSYTFTASDNLANVEGNSLDGDYLGRFPTGDGKVGGAFSIQFTVTNTPPIGSDFRISGLQNHTKIIRPIIQDGEGDLKSIEIVKQPVQGTLVPTSNFGEFLYTPKPGFSGLDGFRLRGVDPVGPGPDFAGTIAVAAAPVDFRPTSMVVADSASIAVGKEVTFTWTVLNTGVGTTLPARWSDEIYLSHDGKWDQDDLKIASFPVNISGIGNGASYKTTQKAIIPFGEWAGEAYLLLKVNTDQGQLENQISNNELATPIKLLPAVSLITPDYSFLGRENPFTIKWRDAVPPSGGQLSFALDTDNIPTNGIGSVVLKTGISASGDGSLDKASVTIPSSIKDGKYFLWACLDSPGGKVYSKPVPVQVFQNAFVGEDERGDATGGGAYEVFGVDLGISQGIVNFRVRTNYSPTSNGGEVYFNIGGNHTTGTGKTVAIGVRNRTNGTGQSIQTGGIYQGASFQGGSVHKDVPVFAESYSSQLVTKANLSVTSTPDRTWQYEINGTTTLEALGAKSGEAIEVGWGMYCGNDFSSTDNGQPPAEEDGRKNILGAGFVIKPTEETGESTTSFRWGTTVKVEFSVVNQGNVAVDATRVRFVLSPDSKITKDDLSVELSSGSIDVPSLPVGQSFKGSVEIQLPKTPPESMNKGGIVVLGMICDSSESVSESDENDNLNFGMGFDKAELRVGRAKVINILIHGYTPPNMTYKEMEDIYRNYRDELKSFAESQPKLKNQVEGYVTEWKSDGGFTLALLDVTMWHLIELVKNGKYVPDLPVGMDDAIAYVNRKLFEYFVIKQNANEFQEKMLFNAAKNMLNARGESINAAYQTIKDLKDQNYKESNGISLLGPPEEGQWIHVIGHSRGGAVGAEVVRQLTAQGYKVGQYTALDGFSVDWPDGEKIQDLDILGAVRQGSAAKMINYQVENSFSDLGDSLIKDKFNEYLSGMLGEKTDISLMRTLFVDNNGQPVDWKAPSRMPLFNDVLMKTNASAGMNRSNHVNITDYYFTQGFAQENPYQAMLDGVSGVRPFIRQGSFSSIMPMESNVSTLDKFTDGNFEKAGQIQRWKSTLEPLGKTGDKTVDALFQRIEKASFGLEDGLYMDGQGSLVQSKTNTVFQIDRKGKANFQEVVQLSPNARYLGFKVSSLVANSGDELRITCNGKVTGRVGLKALAGKGFVNQWFDISEYAGQAVAVEFEVFGVSSKPSKLQMDDLQILANDPGMMKNRPKLGVLEDVTRIQGVASPISIPLKISDADTPLEKLTINYVSDNTSLLPNSGIKVIRNSGTVSLQVTPVSGLTGTAGITIAVGDGATGPDKSPFIVRMHFQLVIQPKDSIAAPGNLTGSVRSGGVNLSWTTPARLPEKGVLDYIVQFRNAVEDSWKVYDEGISTKTNSDLKGFLNGGTYFFRVSAYASNATGQWTPALEIAIPSAPTTDLDGNGQSDLLVVNSTSVISGMLLGPNGKVAGTRNFGNSSTWQLAASGDFDGNGVTDLVWQNSLTLANEIWLMQIDGKVIEKKILKSDKDEKIESTGDFNGDNKEDILWRNSINGQNKISFMNGTSSTQVAFLGGNLDSRPVAISPRFDSNKDGKTDLIWRDKFGGFRLWNMEGLIPIEQFPLPFLVGQEIVGGDDFDGDGYGDIVGWNKQTKQFSVYFLNGEKLSESKKMGISSGSIIVGSDDLNQDGVADLIWQTFNGKTVAGLFRERQLDTTITVPLPEGTVVVRRPGRFVDGVIINPPDSPKDLKVIAGNGQVELSWVAPLNNGGAIVNDYIIQYKSSGSSTYVTFVDGVSATTTATIKGLTNGQEYSFIVFAVNVAGKSGSSDPSPLVKPGIASVPDKPTGLIATPGNGQVFLNWIAPSSNGGSSITDYLVQYRRANEVSWTSFNDGISIGTSATVDGLINGESYFFVVLAKNQVGTSQGSETSTGVIPATVPIAPTGLQAVAGNGIVTLTWLAPLNNGGLSITDYLIQYRENGSGAWKTFNDGISVSTSATVTGLLNGTVYSFIVSARNQIGWGDNSQESNQVIPETGTTIKRVGGVPSGKRGTNTKFTVQLVDAAGSPVVNQPIYFFEFWNWNPLKNPPTYSKMVELNGKNPVYTNSNGVAELFYTIPVSVNADNVRLLAKFNGVSGYRMSFYEIVKIPIG